MMHYTMRQSHGFPVHNAGESQLNNAGIKFGSVNNKVGQNIVGPIFLIADFTRKTDVSKYYLKSNFFFYKSVHYECMSDK